MISLVELRSMAEKRQQEFIRMLDELYGSIEDLDDSLDEAGASSVDWNETMSDLLIVSKYLIASLAADDPAQVLAYKTEYLLKLAGVKYYLSGETLKDPATHFSPLWKTWTPTPRSSMKRIHRMKLELRINQAIKGLVIVDRLVDQVGLISRELSQNRLRAGQRD